MKGAVTITYTNKMSVLVDPVDVQMATAYKWHRSNKYVARSSKADTPRGYTEIYMHREIMGARKGEDVDHIDGNKLDNRRGNLRVCSRSQNKMNCKAHSDNLTGFKGVSFSKQRSKFVAQIKENGVVKGLGYFATAEEAYSSYCARARELHGEFFNPG